MANLIPAAGSIGQQDAQNPGIDFGGMSGTLSKMDPLGNFITKIGGDPLNIYGNKNNPNALLFPGGQNPNAAGAIPSVLPNLGQASMMPQMPQGSFMPLGQMNPMGGNGGGIFNQMAAQSAGQLFNPGMPQQMQAKGGMQPTQALPSPMLGFNRAIGGGSYGRGFQQQ